MTPSAKAFTACGDEPAEDKCLIISGVMAGPDVPAVIELHALCDIPSLNSYASLLLLGDLDDPCRVIVEYDLEDVPLTAGSFYTISDDSIFQTFFGAGPQLDHSWRSTACRLSGSNIMFDKLSDAMAGDVGLVLWFWPGAVFGSCAVRDLFGDSLMELEDHSGRYTPTDQWHYTNGWAYRKNSFGPALPTIATFYETFDINEWTLSGTDALMGVTSASDTDYLNIPFPFGTYYDERTPSPTASPTAPPTGPPTTATPTAYPTAPPTGTPTATPTASPTAPPTGTPTATPTATPTPVPPSHSLCHTQVRTDTTLSEDVKCNCGIESSPLLKLFKGITLDMNGHTVKCMDGTNKTDACIRLFGKGSTAKNGKVANCDVGIRFNGRGSHTVEEVTILTSTVGMLVQSGNNWVYNNTIVDASEGGIEIESKGSGVFVESNYVRVAQGYGIELLEDGITKADIVDNTIVTPEEVCIFDRGLATKNHTDIYIGNNTCN
eukprot:CAMPEP_0194066772 /NCGR_PEP_ID=MMETSP0009_2-20130614/86202_1 /TAXON_ID=210454 /ORGANISM="Grammatophora oceanica, Strain CCMP 410" /LENGTH=491 /DNA_ID=CAMNT_0038719757 /DNA_START=262 /DNA_END=1737 /DNA_ORIENTATION=+